MAMTEQGADQTVWTDGAVDLHVHCAPSFFPRWGDGLDVEGATAPGPGVVHPRAEQRGRAPMPVKLVVTRTDGHADTLTVPVTVWLGGAKRTTVRVAKVPAVKNIEIDPGREFPDVDRDNQRWPR